jgi:hypothetical protein
MSADPMDMNNSKDWHKISFHHFIPFKNADIRREIAGIAGDLGFPIQIRQIKIITFTEESVAKKLVTGNHRHFGESGQWEIIIVLGSEFIEYVNFRYRNYSYGIEEKKLVGGDVVIVPPGCSLALVPLIVNAQVIEISNQEYSNINYEIDELF